jgi:hypothetical protein
MTSGEGTITIRGTFKRAARYIFSIAGIIFSGSIGDVRIALSIHKRACSSIFSFSAFVIPPFALVFVLVILLIFILS